MSKKDKILYIAYVKRFLNFKEVCNAVGIAPNALYLAFNGIDYAISEKKIDEFIAFVKNL